MDSLILAAAISLILTFGHILPSVSLNHSDYQEKAKKIRTYQDLPEKEEFRQNYVLQAGTKVEITDISGSVQIETSSSDTAEVYVVRSARDRKDLEFNKIKVENNGSSFRIFTEPNQGHLNRHGETRQRVIVKLPSNISLSLNDISGSVDAEDIQGTLRIHDISGSVRIGQVGNCEEMHDISGSVHIKQLINCKNINDISGSLDLGIQRLTNNISINDISGSVNLKFADDVNADLKVRDVSGNVSVNLPNWTLTKKQDRSNFEGRIGAGGIAVNISDISGAIKLTQQALN